MRPNDLTKIIEKVDEQKLKFAKEKGRPMTLDDLNQRDRENYGGRFYPSDQVIATFPGKRTHLLAPLPTSDNYYKQLSDLNQDLGFGAYSGKQTFAPVIGLCGAGKPSRSYPTGSGFKAPTEGVLSKTRSAKGDQFLPVTCYKCLKLDYINRMKEEGVAVPMREFDPSDQMPDYSSYGEQKTVAYFKQLTVDEIGFVRQKGNILIIYLNELESEDRRKRFHLIVDESDVEAYRQAFLSEGITVTTEKPTDPETYKRRNQHMMIPMGRFGAFGSNNVVAAESLTTKYAPNDEFDISEFQLDWVPKYFKSKQNTWRANDRILDRRTQQQPSTQKSKNRNFVLTELNLKRYQPYIQALKQATKNRAEDIEFMLEGFQEFADALTFMPIADFFDLDPISDKKRNSDAMIQLYKIIKARRMDEYEKEEYQRSRAREYAEQRKMIKACREKLKQLAIDNGLSRVAAGREASYAIELIKEEGNGLFDPELCTREGINRLKEKKKAREERRKGKLTSQNRPMTQMNPRLDRVLPLLDRVEELDTLFLELEQEYAEIQSRRLRR